MVGVALKPVNVNCFTKRGASAMPDVALFAAVDIAIVAALLFYRDPRWLIPLVVIGLPIEYFNTQAVDSLGSNGITGAFRALLNPGKLAMLLTILVAVVRFRHTPRKLFPDSALVVPLLAMLALITLGLFWSDSLKAPNSILILPMYVAFVFVAPSFIESEDDLKRIVACVFVTAIALGALAAAQRTGFFNWRAILVQSDDYSYRANATFADPNHLARFLALALSLAGGAILVMGPRRLTLYLAIPALVIGAVGTVATASRSGWIMLLLCGFLVVVISPIASGTKLRLVSAAAGSLAALLVLLLFQGGADADRVRSLTTGVEVIGQREFLIKAGWAMFKDNPIYGVGSGNYQHALLLSYINLIPDWARTTLSHTSLISILAEQGILGAAMFGFVGLRLAIVMTRKFLFAADPFVRLITGWLGVSFIGIVLHSQSEGRLIDEPYLWLLLGVFVALETVPAFASERDLAELRPDPVPVTARRRAIRLAPAKETLLAPGSTITTAKD